MTTGAQIYIGGLKGEVMPEDLKYEFKKFGSITEFSYKGRYAFIEYEAADSASRAIKEMDDQRVAPSRVRITVEAASKCGINFSTFLYLSLSLSSKIIAEFSAMIFSSTSFTYSIFFM